MELNEATRLELINKSKSAEVVKSYGTTRYDRRNLLHLSKSVNSFNKIDFNALFRANLLSFKIPIKGETNTYEIGILFEHVCDDIKREIKANNNQLDYKCVYRALVDSVNKQDISVSCTCEDWKYRLAYAATLQGYNSGQPELRPAKITNPDDTAGAGCKHIMSALGNLDWVLKLASSVYNYIMYMHDSDEQLFKSAIFPAIFSIPYEEYNLSLSEEEVDLVPEEEPVELQNITPEDREEPEEEEVENT